MERVKIIWCGVAILSLLCIFSVPMANAQKLEFDGEAKAKGAFFETLTAAKVTAAGKFFVRIEQVARPSTCEGIGYDISEVEDDCGLRPLGWIDTCGDDETTAWGRLEFEDVPNTGQTIICFFNGVVGNKKLKSKGFSCWVEDGDSSTVMLGSKFKLQAKEKDITKKLDCNL